MKSIYIGNLTYTTTQQQVHDIFAQFGNVISSRMILDKTTHKFKGYAFVEMEDVVLIILHGADFKSRGKIRNFLLPGMSKIDDLLEFVLAEE